MRSATLSIGVLLCLAGCGDDDAPPPVIDCNPGPASHCPTGGETTTDGETFGSSSSADTTGGGGSSSGDTSSSSGPMPCADNEECTDPGAPLCNISIGECTTCGELNMPDAGCAELDVMAPLCVADECVACTADDASVCDAQLLVCDDTTNECGPCTEHAQCDSGACDVAAGTCFDPVNVFDVGPGQTYVDIAAGLGAVEAMALDSAVLRLHGGMDFNEVATVSDGTLAFIAAEGQAPQWINSAVLAPTLTVEGAETTVYIDGLRLSGNQNDVGIVVTREG